MPAYYPGFEGSYTNSYPKPVTLNHVTQFLGGVDDENWEIIQKQAKHLRAHPNHVKIKPESYEKIISTKSHDLVRHVISEHIDHFDHSKNAHVGGGIHEGVLNVMETVAQTVGGEKVSKWINPEVPKKELSEDQKEMARMVKGTYEQKRWDKVDEWTRIPDYDTRYGSLWENPEGEYTYSIRGSKLLVRDIWKDIKVFFGSGSQGDKDLEKSFERFKTEHPLKRVNIAMHSLGTELGFNAIDRTGIPTNDIYAFNPGSSPLMSKKHIRKQLDRPNLNLFLSANDLVSKYYKQNLTAEDADETWYGRFYRSPVASHGISQWFED